MVFLRTYPIEVGLKVIARAIGGQIDAKTISIPGTTTFQETRLVTANPKGE